MLLYAGIDEAGYGPVIGPLCLGMVLLEVDADPADGAPPLWERLDAVVCRELRDPRGRIPVDDSKRLKGARSAKGHPLRHLERGVLAFHGVLEPAADGPVAAGSPTDGPGAAAAAPPPDDATLFDALACPTPPQPWYGEPVELPVAGDLGSLRIDVARLRRGLAAAGVRVLALRAAAVDAPDLNAGLDRTGSKAAVNLEAALRLVDAARRARPHGHPRIVVDRHGGRTRYREELARAWAGSRVDVVAERPELSRYLVRDDAGEATISFAPEADQRHFPVALASMTAKLVRELLMIRLNRYFAGHRPGLRPTAGYFADGTRWIADVESVLEPLGIVRDELVRRA